MAERENNTLTAGQWIYMVLSVLTCPAIVLLLSGDWSWVEGWIFDVWFLTVCASTIIHLFRNDPRLLAERFRHPGEGNQKKWDTYFVVALVIAYLSWLVIMPIDAKRYGWTPDFPLWSKVLGGMELAVSFFLFYRSYTENTFASPLVRIQTERKQRVVSTGVYGFVRHPMYLGAILMLTGTPLVLSSKYGILMGGIISFLLAGRTIGEEKMLVEELEGYADYKKKVRFRLIPFVW